MTANKALYGVTGQFGTCWYDASFGLLKCVDSAIAAGTPAVGPAGAAWIRFFVPVNSTSGASASTLVDVTQLIVVEGSTAATAYQSFGYVNPTQLTQATAQVNAGVATTSLSIVNASLPAGGNLFDVNRSITPGVYLTNGTLSSGYAGFTATPKIPVAGLTNIVASGNLLGATGQFASIFTDVSGAVVKVIDSNTPAGTAIAVPSNAAWFFAYFASASTSGQTPLFDPSKFMIVSGTVVPSSYVAFGYVRQDQLTTQLATKTSLGGAGKKFGVFGDSYSGRLRGRSLRRAYRCLSLRGRGMRQAECRTRERRRGSTHFLR